LLRDFSEARHVRRVAISNLCAYHL
jgi:hypothetical protein